jgi:hypothetical protein
VLQGHERMQRQGRLPRGPAFLRWPERVQRAGWLQWPLSQVAAANEGQFGSADPNWPLARQESQFGSELTFGFRERLVAGMDLVLSLMPHQRLPRAREIGVLFTACARTGTDRGAHGASSAPVPRPIRAGAGRACRPRRAGRGARSGARLAVHGVSADRPRRFGSGVRLRSSDAQRRRELAAPACGAPKSSAGARAISRDAALRNRQA